MRIGLNMHQVQLSLLNSLLMHSLTMDPCSITPIGYRPFIQVKGMDNGLDWASIRQKRDDNYNQVHWFTQSKEHRAPTSTKGVLAGFATIALSFAIMDDDVALFSLASRREHIVFGQNGLDVSIGSAMSVCIGISCRWIPIFSSPLPNFTS